MVQSINKTALVAELQQWWNDQVSTQNDPFAEKGVEGTIYDVIPEIDSHAAVSGLVAMEKHVGFKIPSRVIRRGGYKNFEDMMQDLLPKLDALVEKKAAKEKQKRSAA